MPGPSPTFTVFGASGFVGSHLVRWLEKKGIRPRCPGRGQLIGDHALGHAIYCIGLTADFRERPFDTVEAHVCTLAHVLEHAEFESFLYLSSTRVYAGAETGSENQTLAVDPNRAEDLYTLSKLTGESLCLSSGKEKVRVARLSNVYGADFSSQNFLTSLLQDVVTSNRVVLRTALDSAKDYVSVDDVVSILPAISVSGQYRIYNVASGVNTTHGEIVETLQRETGCDVRVLTNARTTRFPPITVARLRQEFDFRAGSLIPALPALLDAFRRHHRR